MSAHHSSEPYDHEACWDLIPWYVNETLTTEEAERVVRHVDACETCRMEVREQRRLADALSHDANERADVDDGWQRLLRALDVEPQGPSSRRTSRQRFLIAAAIVQLVLFGGMIGFVGWLHAPSNQSRFRTLSTPAALTTVGSRLRVVPAPETTVSTLQASLLAVDGRIIDGPTPAGAFTVSVPVARREEALSALRSEPFILLAEPLPSEGP